MPEKAYFQEKPRLLAHYWLAPEANSSLDHALQTFGTQSISILLKNSSPSYQRTQRVLRSLKAAILFSHRKWQKRAHRYTLPGKQHPSLPQHCWSQSSSAFADGQLLDDSIAGCFDTPWGAPRAGNKWQQSGCSCCSVKTRIQRTLVTHNSRYAATTHCYNKDFVIVYSKNK